MALSHLDLLPLFVETVWNVRSLLIRRTAGETAGKAMSRIYSNIGFRGLWNGLPVRIVMIGTLTVSLTSALSLGRFLLEAPETTC